MLFVAATGFIGLTDFFIHSAEGFMAQCSAISDGQIRRVLIFSMQPPPFNGVQAIRYGKLIEPLRNLGWELHFVGPDPRVTSVVRATPYDPGQTGHYFEDVPLGTRAAVRRRQTRGLFKVCWLLAQVLGRGLEKVGIESSFEARVQQSMTREGQRLLSVNHFDLVAGIHPSFWVLQVAMNLARESHKPFLAIYDDPHGSRTVEGFTPNDREAQSELIAAAAGVAFASPLTRDRYLLCFPSARGKTYYVSDSFVDSTRQESIGSQEEVSLVHLGNIGDWRPIESFLKALTEIRHPKGKIVLFKQYGYVYPGAVRIIDAINRRSSVCVLSAEIDYIASLKAAHQADILLIIVGPRHLDNFPSKFFEYLPARKPLLFIGPPEHLIGRLIENLGIGLRADISSEAEIAHQLQALLSNSKRFTDAYVEKSGEIDQYRVDRVATVWADVFERSIGSPAHP